MTKYETLKKKRLPITHILLTLQMTFLKPIYYYLIQCVCRYVSKYMYLGLSTGGHFVESERGLLLPTTTFDDYINHSWGAVDTPSLPPVSGAGGRLTVRPENCWCDGRIHRTESLVNVYVKISSFQVIWLYRAEWLKWDWVLERI